jgi:hypothetical protein
MRQEIKQAFKKETINGVQAWDVDSGQAHFLTQAFIIFVVETEMGRKGFGTFDGAFNRFMNISKGFDLAVILNDGNTVDVDAFITEVA